MKKLFLIVTVVHFFSYGQNSNWDTALSQIYQPISGFEAKKVLLDKASAFSDLYNFNDGDHNTSDAIHFKQALSELYSASNQQYFSNYTNFPNFNTVINSSSSIPIGIVSTKCAYLHYDEENPSNGNLTLSNGIFYPINPTVTNFIEKDLLVVSPLFPAFTSNTNSFTFSINPSQWYQYVNNIKKLEANFGDGVFRTLRYNGHFLGCFFHVLF